MRDETSRPSWRGHIERLSPEEKLRLSGLTHRETQVAILIARGHLVRVVAEKTSVETGTVKTLLSRAREKLGCRTTRDLATFLLREGIVTPLEMYDPHESPS